MIPEEQPDQSTGVNRPTRSEEVAQTGGPTDTVRIPVLEEQLAIDKRVVETGRLRLIKTVEEEPQTVDIQLLTEQIDIERVAVDRLVDEAPATRQEGNTTIYPVLKEEYVIQKRLRLIEEIRVTKRQVQTADQQSVVLRRENVAVERTPAERTPADEFVKQSDSAGELSL